MNLLNAQEARKISEQTNIEKYKQEIEEILLIVKIAAERGKFKIHLSRNNYVKTILKNKKFFEEGGYRVKYYGGLMYDYPTVTISW